MCRRGCVQKSNQGSILRHAPGGMRQMKKTACHSVLRKWATGDRTGETAGLDAKEGQGAFRTLGRPCQGASCDSAPSCSPGKLGLWQLACWGGHTHIGTRLSYSSSSVVYKVLSVLFSSLVPVTPRRGPWNSLAGSRRSNVMASQGHTAGKRQLALKRRV